MAYLALYGTPGVALRDPSLLLPRQQPRTDSVSVIDNAKSFLLLRAPWKVRDVARNLRLSVSDASYGMEQVNVPGVGTGINLNLATVANLTVSGFTATQDYTVVLGLMVKTSYSSLRSLIDDDNGTTRRLQLRLTTAQVLELILWDSSGTIQINTTLGITLSTGIPYVLAMRVKSGMTKVLANSESWSSATSYTPRGLVDPALWYRKTFEQYGRGITMTHLALYDYALSDAQLAERVRNPYGMLRLTDSLRSWSYTTSLPTALPFRALDGPFYGSLRGSVR